MENEMHDKNNMKASKGKIKVYCYNIVIFYIEFDIIT